MRTRRSNFMAQQCLHGLGVCLLVVMASCGGGSGSGGASEASWAPPQGPEDVLVEVQTSIDAAEGLLFSMQSASAQARLQSAIESARDELTRMRAACAQQGTHDVFACASAPGPAVTTAGDALARSLGDMAQELAVKRGVIPPDDPEKRPGRCRAKRVCPHRGGNAHHDECADREPPNKWPGCDARVDKTHFDAITTQAALWEVKTDAWSSYSDFLKRLTRLRHILNARLEHRVATSCGYPFVFAVADAELYSTLAAELREIDVRHVPRCAR